VVAETTVTKVSSVRESGRAAPCREGMLPFERATLDRAGGSGVGAKQ
jgi:hypothetical protein